MVYSCGTEESFLREIELLQSLDLSLCDDL